MKAKIKKTGEIVNIAEYAKIALDICDSWGNTIELRPDEVELIQEPTKDEHWQYIRERAAIAALQGLLSNPKQIGNAWQYVKVAIDCANTLVGQLKKK